MSDRQLVLVGVMSAGIGCGRERLPGVYTRVEKFTRWVEDIISNGGNEVKRHRRDAAELGYDVEEDEVSPRQLALQEQQRQRHQSSSRRALWQ